MPTVVCAFCGAKFYVTPYRSKTSKYCSRTCKHKGLRKHNNYQIFKDYALIEINNSKYGIMHAIIDLKDIKLCQKYYWNVRKNKNIFYVESYTGSKTGKERTHLHRLLNKTPDNLVTDHINGNSLDNRRSNLRAVTQRINTLNRHVVNNNTGVRGVYKDKYNYRAKIGNLYLGMFKTLEEAKFAREEAIKKYA